MKLFKSFLIIIIFCSAALAAPNLLRFQGRLTNSDGNPIPGQPRVRFAIYNVESGGAAVWAQPQPMVVNSNDNGLFSTNIDVPANIFDTDLPLYLEVIVQGVAGEQTLSPRQQLTSVPFAFGAANADRAAIADDVANLSITSDKLANGAVMRSKIADNAVGALQIEDGSVSFLDIAPDSIRTEHIRDGEVEFVDLATDAVTSDNIQDGSVKSIDIGTDSITSDHIVDNSISANKLQLGQISLNHLDSAVNEFLVPGMIVMFAGACPNGWSTLTEAEGRFPRGMIDGSPIVTGGTDTISGMQTEVDGAHQHQIESNALANHTHHHDHKHVSPVSVSVDGRNTLFFPWGQNDWGEGAISKASSAQLHETPFGEITGSRPWLLTSNPTVATTDPPQENLSSFLSSSNLDGQHSHNIQNKNFVPSFFGVHFCVKN